MFVVQWDENELKMACELSMEMPRGKVSRVSDAGDGELDHLSRAGQRRNLCRSKSQPEM